VLLAPIPRASGRFTMNECRKLLRWVYRTPYNEPEQHNR
jgi:hypothetical protein